MVGLVIVSHSAKVAEGVKEISAEMAGEELKIVTAGGMSDGSISAALRSCQQLTRLF